MRIFIVHAHPEPYSFNGALTRAAQGALSAAGHEVVVSDLYAMGFNPVSDRRNFTTVRDPNYYRQQSEEANAAALVLSIARRGLVLRLRGHRAYHKSTKSKRCAEIRHRDLANQRKK
ncbi:NAD(P)H-dependent oxidoreductase [Mesorhizobium sp. M1B.F.Ca.ET.045.04.1.1]|uniref:NAD(P)H-dependent oxidoreductase n=1 Tax=Mesorhizobium sp. M1B.F.Ca.ET.045.04.1.1 TaxID=2493673 RepID=UPI000F751B11|nr:NAD(P)H-dependent oxidoreductase [Mesorhizobium sp. M1B.F.Ca.ET.045.04.1.1]AZO28938.1 hypothetical protein EJ071_17170 [Mesorhizobium sp. M1B.F.Ca.ET.045.04.1.1]